VFNSDYLYIYKKCASHFFKETTIEKIVFKVLNIDIYIIHNLADKASKVNFECCHFCTESHLKLRLQSL